MVENIIPIKSRIAIHVDVSIRTWKKPTTFTFHNSDYLASIIHNSVITCDQFIEEKKTTPTRTLPTKTVPSNFIEKR